MAKRPNKNDESGQLNLFSFNKNRYDSNDTNHTDTIRQDGGETLARISPEHGGGNGGQRDLEEMLLEAEEKTASEMHDLTMKFQKQGLTAQQAHDRAWEMVREEYILLPPEGTGRVIRNQNNYRISPADGVGKGSPKEKCRANLAAIKLARKLQAENRPATQEEKSALVRYVGWGGLPQIFNPATDWQAESLELAKLLSKEEFRLARASTLNAHYTSGEVIQGMYAALERLGFKEGRILEPACGIGHFIGFMPESMQSQSVITGIEIDPVTAQIAKALYPDADIRNEPFEKANLADEFFDVAISNIPFGDYKPYDPKFNKQGFLIHDYFFAAGLEKVRPGGLVMFITSRGTMDKIDSHAAKILPTAPIWLAQSGCPTRLSNATPTPKSPPMLSFLKTRGRESSHGAAWKKVIPYTTTKGEVISINEYFVENPHMMLGEMRLEGRMYGRNEPTLVSDGRDIKTALAEAIKHLPQKIYKPVERPKVVTAAEQAIPAPGHVKPNAYTVHDDQIAIREGDKLVPLPHLAIQTKLRIRGMIQVRDAVRQCLRTQLEDADEDDIKLARTQLNQAYDRFVARNGPVSDRVNALAFRGDPDLPLLFSLENYDSETNKAVKAAIFRERTIQKQKSITSAESPKEAVIISLNEKGRVDLQHMASLLGRPAEEFLPELKGILFFNPQSREWETEDHYLSGDVREKLQTAEVASINEPRFHENVEALKSVQPENLSATQIDARLGACWIPVKDVEAFAQELLGAEDVTIRFTPQLGTWTVQAGYMAKGSVANTTDWGTNRASALELMEDALNLRTPTIYDKVRDGNKDKQVVNPNVDGGGTRKTAENQRPVPGMDLAERRTPRTACHKIQRGIQLRPAARFQRRTPDVAGRKPHHSTASAPEIGRLAHPANAEHTARPRCRRGKNLHDGCGGHGVETAGAGAQADVHRSQPHARPVFG